MLKAAYYNRAAKVSDDSCTCRTIHSTCIQESDRYCL